MNFFLVLLFFVQKIISCLTDLDNVEEAIPLPNVTSSVLEKIIEYCVQYNRPVVVEEKPKDGESTSVVLNDWDLSFFSPLDQATLYELIKAANYLHIEDLLNKGCKRVATLIAGKTPQEMRIILGIENDLTPEEVEAIQKENAFCQTD